ncbi:UNVERIFIED_CONTAM: hypothetical protein GTU68_049861 [Idotea baltica]|nr:hypothetical protein [Idotea baltica]
MKFSWYDSKIGRILLVGDEAGLSHLLFESGKHFQTHGISPDWQENPAPFKQCIQQLNEYFDGERKQFDVSLNLSGTEFQRRVWEELTRIEYGQTISYAELANRIGQPGASRAVGSANGKNPISIVIPCHRVIGSGGKLAGYSGGLSNKLSLLQLEGLQVHGTDDAARATVGTRQQQLQFS